MMRPKSAPAPRDTLRRPVSFRNRTRPGDAAAVKRLVRATGFFSQEEVEIAVELVEERVAKGAASGYEFIFAEFAAKVIGYACFGRIPGTRHSFDLYWIVVDPRLQGKGIGRALLARAEAAIRQAGGQRVYIETSSRQQYGPTRAFYEQVGYRAAARLADFYAPGDGKLIYAKPV